MHQISILLLPWIEHLPFVMVLQSHRELAREAVRKSLVLLKNGKDSSKPLLPLDKNAKRILVIGSHADDLGFQCGGWTGTWHGSGGRITVGMLLTCLNLCQS